MTRLSSCTVAWIVALSLTWAGCGEPSSPGRRDAGSSDGGGAGGDGDGDGILDEDEGRRDARDTDGDGTPDHLDDDSDDDGILDADEAGDSDPSTPPRDSDHDGRPDFVDFDSDDNGLDDVVEARGDTDGDARPDYADLDDDADGLADVRELRGMTDSPADTDGDGVPDYQDPDGDDDTIVDGQDGDLDTDGDGSPDFVDLDSDEDSIPDSAEAGDDDLLTLPIDTDEDGTPDYRNPDSDGDGLSDRDEATAHGTSPTSIDTDGDGVGDLIEIGAGTDATDMTDSPRTRGDFVFTVPYMEPPDPTRDTLSFRTSIQFADLYFSFDTTGSMSAELAAMASPSTGVPAIIDALRCAPTGESCGTDEDCTTGICFGGGCIVDPTSGAGCVPDMWTGVATWDVLNTFRNRVSLQPDPAVTAAAIPGTGGGSTEAPFQPPYCVANASTPGCSGCATTGIRCGGFRPDAIRIYIQITDADQQCSGSACSMYTAAGAGAALASQNIRFIGLYGTDDASGSGTPQSVAESIGIAAGTVDASGRPYVYLAVDAAVVTSTVDAVRAIVRGVPLRVTIAASDEPADAGDALQFIDRLETNTTAAGCAAIGTGDTDRDGFPDAFPAVTPGTRVCWDVVPLRNDTVMPTAEPQVFKARLTVSGDGSPLDSRMVYFLVPPRPPVIEGPG